MGYLMCPYFMIWPLFRFWAEICQIFHWFFGKFKNIKKTFWDYLTFRRGKETRRRKKKPFCFYQVLSCVRLFRTTAVEFHHILYIRTVSFCSFNFLWLVCSRQKLGILKMVSLKKQGLWPKINILKGNHCIWRIRGAPIRQKLGMIVENKVVQK